MRAALCWASLLLAFVPCAHAAERVFIADGLAPTAVEAALLKAGLEGAPQRSWADLMAGVQITGLVRARPTGCAGVPTMPVWRERLGQARSKVQALQFDVALRELSGLELDLGCMLALPQQSDLFRFHLVVAEARMLAAQGAADPDVQAFEMDEARYHLLRAAIVSPEGQPEQHFLPEVGAGLTAVRARMGQSEWVPIRVAGPPTAVSWDASERPEALFWAAPGVHLLQARAGETVVAVRPVQVSRGRPVILWVDPGGTVPAAMDLAAALRRLDTEGVGDGLLVAALEAAAGRDRGHLVTGAATQIQVWTVSEGRLNLRYRSLEP